jgi:hypothetical protein
MLSVMMMILIVVFVIVSALALLMWRSTCVMMKGPRGDMILCPRHTRYHFIMMGYRDVVS